MNHGRSRTPTVTRGSCKQVLETLSLDHRGFVTGAERTDASHSVFSEEELRAARGRCRTNSRIPSGWNSTHLRIHPSTRARVKTLRSSSREEAVERIRREGEDVSPVLGDGDGCVVESSGSGSSRVGGEAKRSFCKSGSFSGGPKKLSLRGRREGVRGLWAPP